MNKYEPLNQFLGRLHADYWRPTFLELERILEFKLPASARKNAGWWEKDGAANRPAQAWANAGWKVEGVDLDRQRVTFVRSGAAQAPAENGAAHDTIADRLRSRAEALAGQAGAGGRRAVELARRRPVTTAGVSAGAAFAAGVGLGFLLFRALREPEEPVVVEIEDRTHQTLAMLTERLHDLVNLAGERLRSLRA